MREVVDMGGTEVYVSNIQSDRVDSGTGYHFLTCDIETMEYRKYGVCVYLNAEQYRTATKSGYYVK